MRFRPLPSSGQTGRAAIWLSFMIEASPPTHQRPTPRISILDSAQPKSALASSHCECTLNFPAAAQNRLDFADKRSVDAQGRPRPF